MTATDGKSTATRLLRHYFRLLADSAGVRWDSDNDAEVEQIVDALLDAAHEDAGAVAQDVLRGAILERDAEHTQEDTPTLEELADGDAYHARLVAKQEAQQ